MTNTIDQDLIDDAKKAGFVTFEGEKGDIEFDTYDFTLAECLAKFAQLQRERQAQHTPSQSDECEGYKIVPIEPTEAMYLASINSGSPWNITDAYKAMINAAPSKDE